MLGALTVAVLAGCAGPPIPSAATLPGDGVTVIDRGWHTDVALPAQAMAGPLAGLGRSFPGASFLVFGFGDRGFYMVPGFPVLGMAAALFPGPGVILVTGLRADPAEAFGADNVVTLALPPDRRTDVAAFIGRAMAPDGRLRPIADGPYPGSLFFASDLTYDAFDDCNRWTVAALASGGLAADPDGIVFAGQVMTLARRLAAEQAGGG